MKTYEKVKNQPREIRSHPERHSDSYEMSADDVNEITEIFNTPLVGTYNWDYSMPNTRIKKLYNLGKRLNWDVDVDLDWEQPFPKNEFPLKEECNPFRGFSPYDTLPEQEKIEISWARLGASLSSMLHGEQGALLVASQLTNCVPSHEAKLFAASQTFDEARHVEFFNKVIQRYVKKIYPCKSGLKTVMDKILTDRRWDLKFIGMQVIIESLARVSFTAMAAETNIPALKKGLDLIDRDEARHVTFGLNYLKEYLGTLSAEELNERAEFALEAVLILKGVAPSGRSGSELPFSAEAYGWDLEELRTHVKENRKITGSSRDLYEVILPILEDLGLLTEEVRPQWEFARSCTN